MQYTEIIKKLGLSEKAADIYLANLQLGEATIQQLSKQAHVKRTTIYYVLTELEDLGALIQVKRKNKIYYQAADPANVLARSRERLREVEQALPLLEEQKLAVYNKPRVYISQGSTGFKTVWDKLFSSEVTEFSLLTEGVNFLDYVKERYIVEQIIQTKNRRKIKSRQLIVDSIYARKIVAKDAQENRVSKLLPAQTKLPYTELIFGNFVAFISPKWENSILLLESHDLAHMQLSAFNLLWESIYLKN